MADRGARLSDDLRDLIEVIASETPSVDTVGHGEPNQIVEVRPEGVMITTAQTSGAPQLVPAWMFEVAWSHLKEHGLLESRFLQASDGLNVKRSAAVMAVLARVGGVRSATRPARLFLGDNDPHGVRNPDWDDDERALALDLYLRCGARSKTDPAVVDLSDWLRARAEAAAVVRNDAFRNPTGVAMKLANFAAIDPAHAGRGMSRHSRGDLATWHEYSGDRDELTERVDEIRVGQAHEFDSSSGMAMSIEQQHVVSFEVTINAAIRAATRVEAGLVADFAAWLERQGHRVGSDRHDVGTGALRPDLLDYTEPRIWEAKSEVGRNAIRLAIGQLFDYRRWRPDWPLGVVVPHRPSDDLIDLCHSVDATVAWRSTDSAESFVTNIADQTGRA